MVQDQQTPSDQISLKELIEKSKEWYLYFLSQWKIIVLAGVLGAVLGLTYSFIKKPVYTATLSFVIEDDKSGGGLSGALGLASQFGIDLGSGGGAGVGARSWRRMEVLELRWDGEPGNTAAPL